MSCALYKSFIPYPCPFLHLQIGVNQPPRKNSDSCYGPLHSPTGTIFFYEAAEGIYFAFTQSLTILTSPVTTPVAALINIAAIALPVVSTMVAETAAEKLKETFPTPLSHHYSGPVVAKVRHSS